MKIAKTKVKGDLTIAAEKITPQAINFMAQYGRGLICLAMTPERLDALEIPLMVSQNSSRFETAFCLSIEAREGTTTGISTADRAATVLTTFSTDGNPLTPFEIIRHRQSDDKFRERVNSDSSV